MASSGIPAARARVFLFEAKSGESVQQLHDRVNEWFARDRSGSKYPHLTIHSVSLQFTAQGAALTVLVDLGDQAAEAPAPPA